MIQCQDSSNRQAPLGLPAQGWWGCTQGYHICMFCKLQLGYPMHMPYQMAPVNTCPPCPATAATHPTWGLRGVPICPQLDPHPLFHSCLTRRFPPSFSLPSPHLFFLPAAAPAPPQRGQRQAPGQAPQDSQPHLRRTPVPRSGA